jgi:hypothetical protein
MSGRRFPLVSATPAGGDWRQTIVLPPAAPAAVLAPPPPPPADECVPRIFYIGGSGYGGNYHFWLDGAGDRDYELIIETVTPPDASYNWTRNEEHEGIPVPTWYMDLLGQWCGIPATVRAIVAGPNAPAVDPIEIELWIACA